jgi:Chaperone of endosialidase
MNRSPLRLVFLLNALALAVAWLAPWQLANAQCPQGCDASTRNTALGGFALNGDHGNNNTAIGYSALYSDMIGFSNTALGAYSLLSNTDGFGNTADGVGALENNTTGNGNTATGDGALGSNTTGSVNTANGYGALGSNTTGSLNTASGFTALVLNTTGSNNIALGSAAGQNLTTGSNNIDIGNVGSARESNIIRIGTTGTQVKTFIAGISGATVPGGVGVIVGTNGQLGTIVSSARFKDEVKPMDKASEAILALKPVTFRYKHEFDPDGIPQFGLVAEEVEKVNPDLVARDEQGKPYTVRYEAVNAMLLNEFLKEHQTVQELKKQVAELTAGLQKVSAQLEVNKPATQTALNNR